MSQALPDASLLPAVRTPHMSGMNQEENLLLELGLRGFSVTCKDRTACLSLLVRILGGELGRLRAPYLPGDCDLRRDKAQTTLRLKASLCINLQ